MRHWPFATLMYAVLITCAPFAAAENAPPAPGNALLARFALRYNPETRCPAVRPASPDEKGVAVVLFQVGPTGVPSQASIRASSQSAPLDAAALECVLKLRFQPATRLGDGTAVESWQQMGWKWTQQPGSPETSAAATPSAATSAAAAGSVGAVQTSVPAPRSASPRLSHTAEVRACVDRAGKLLNEPTIVHSSGDGGLDAAAVNIARSGSAYYRPSPAAGGGPASGCVDLTIGFESE
jgi:TonB family protein